MTKAARKGTRAAPKRGQVNAEEEDDIEALPTEEEQNEDHENEEDNVEDDENEVIVEVTMDAGEEAAHVPDTDAEATAAAVEAAVAASASAAARHAVAAAAHTSTALDPSVPSDRDVILGEGSAGHKTNLLLQDVIRLHRILWKLHGKPPPTGAADVRGMASHIINIIKHGKQLDLAGLKDVPKPFMRSSGRFFGKDVATGAWKILGDDELDTIMADIILDEFKVDDLGPLTESPYKDLKAWMAKTPLVGSVTDDFLPEAKDAILFPLDFETDKMYEHQEGNKTLFHLASQLVAAHTNSPDKRVEAALSIMKGLDETLESMEASDNATHQATTTKTARFLIRKLREDRHVAWDLMDPASAAELTVIFVFEVYLEKEIHITSTDAVLFTGLPANANDEEDTDTSKPSTEPIVDSTDYDVLFGRGGMTNRCVSHYASVFF